MNNLLKGLFTALITPFKNDKIDYPSLTKILEYQDKNYVAGLVVCGTTGEGPSLNFNEKENLFNFAREFYRDRKILIGGISSYTFAHTLEEARLALRCGMDALLVNPPIYLKTNANGIERFYKTISDNTGLPIILYNVPARTGYSLDIGVLEKLNKINLIKAIKECSNNFEYVMHIKRYTNFEILCGNDMLYLQYLISGAVGIVSVVSNIFPGLIYKLQKYFIENKVKKSIELIYKSHHFMKTLFSEPNPIGIKVAMSSCGFCEEIYRLPLNRADNNNRLNIISSCRKLKRVLNNIE